MLDTTILLVIITLTSPSWIHDTGITSTITEAVSSWITEYGYPAVFLSALLENLFPPIPSEVIFPLVGFIAYSNNLGLVHAISMGLVGALGSTVGAIIIYYISMRIGKPTILRYGRYVGIGEKGLLKAELWFQKYGAVAVFTGRMAPAVRELISIPAGLGQMNIMKFIIFTFLGSAIWSIALTLLGYFLGDTWNIVKDQVSSVLGLAAVIIIIIIISIIGLKLYRQKRNPLDRGRYKESE